ncbi:MAG: hypothetical protein KatS3mg105_3883 [Gemmatales bacterium]|nr:MAG: hypothetical protein KatS3mg105_3883 [Gemmatales bacterium]
MNREHEAALLLESIFSEAVDMGADAIEFQPLPGEGLEFTFLAGKTEKSRILRDEALEKLILDRIINEAGLQKNKEGQFAIETERGPDFRLGKNVQESRGPLLFAGADGGQAKSGWGPWGRLGLTAG